MRYCYRPCHTSCCCFCCYLFLSMVVWQPFQGCWRLIIARISEMHVAYHSRREIVGSLFIGTNKQTAEQWLGLLMVNLPHLLQWMFHILFLCVYSVVYRVSSSLRVCIEEILRHIQTARGRERIKKQPK
jgi:hypothetical protein